MEKLCRCLFPEAAFGLSHAGYLNQGFIVWLEIMRANRISEDDVGHRLPSRSSQPGSNRDCALFERRDGISVDRVFMVTATR